MKRIFRKGFPALTAALIALMLATAAFTLGADGREATEKEVREMEKALQRYVELFYTFAPDLREELLTAAYISDRRVEKLRKDLHRDLLKVATEEHANRELEGMLGAMLPYSAELSETANKYRLIDGGAEVLAIYDIEFTGPDTANVLAIVWSGSRLGQFDLATNRITFAFAADNTMVLRYPMRLIDGKWKVAGNWEIVKGSPLDGCDVTYGPPTTDPEEVKRVWEAEGYTWDEKYRRGMLDDIGAGSYNQ